jgi:hypothetical protein
VRRLIALVAVSGMTLLGFVAAGGPARATPPQKNSFSDRLRFVDNSTCSFPITDRENVTGTETDYFDGQGNMVTVRFHLTIIGTDSAKGVSLQDDSRHDSVFDIEAGTDTDVGLTAWVRLPDGGVILRGAGKVVFDADGNVLFEAGPHPFLHGDTAAYCAAFG